jgi:hypothetical protein
MHPDPTTPTTTAAAASALVASLEHAWTAIQAQHPQVPHAVLVVASGHAGKHLALGHFAPHRWRVAQTDRHEVLIGAEGLRRGPVDVLGTLLHEAAHGLAAVRSVKDTSRQGRYHNRRYAALADELGLTVEHAEVLGWSTTSVPQPTAAAYAAQLAELAAALVLWRRAEPPPATGKARNLLACACACPRRIRVARSVLDQAPILCAACGDPFQPDPVDE